MSTTEPRRVSATDHDVETLRDEALDAVTGGACFLANSSHTSLSESAEALKAVAQK
jgi:hypothetical protein